MQYQSHFCRLLNEKTMEGYIMVQNNGALRQPPGKAYTLYKVLNLRKQVGHFVFIRSTKSKQHPYFQR